MPRRRGAFVLGLLGWALPAAAQQVVLVDTTYTATTANTMDSHYWVDPSQQPSNWRSPVDYASGKVHARLEVLDKPSGAPTLYNICFEAPSNYACMPYSPAYTEAGVYDFEYPFSAFYQYDLVDWTEPIDQVAFVLKDENEIKAQGDPAFYPTTIHITLVLVPPGESYVEPAFTIDAGVADDAGGAGDPGAGDPGAGGEDPGTPSDAGAPPGAAQPPATTPPPDDPSPAPGAIGEAAGSGSSAPPASGPPPAMSGAGGVPGQEPSSATADTPRWHRSSGTACSIGIEGAASGPLALLGAAFAMLASRLRYRRSRRPPHAAATDARQTATW